MSTHKKVLLGEEDCKLLHDMRVLFSNWGFECITVHKNGLDVLSEIQDQEPDVVIMEAFMSGLDALGVIQRLDSVSPKKKPFIAIISTGLSESLEKTLLGIGASYCFIKPIEASEIVERVVFLTDSSRTESESIFTPNFTKADLEESVTEIIKQLGVPAHIKGYHFMRSAIMFVVEKPEMMESVTQILYEAIAEQFNSTSTRVERAIRHAIDIAWTRGDKNVISSYFGCTIRSARGKPTNSEFIAMISDGLRMKIKHSS